MLHSAKAHAASRLTGAILMVVLVLLALFAVVGIAFVIFAEEELSSATLFSSSETRILPDPDLVFSFAMNQLVFDTKNPLSALHSHGLLTNMYGASGTIPFNGSGRLHTDKKAPDALRPVDLFYMPRFPMVLGPYDETDHGALNPPYTYPDHNHRFLGILTKDGTVEARSFVRSAAPGRPDPFLPANYQWWLDQDDFYQNLPADLQALERIRRRMEVMRPRPTDHAGFPAPEDYGGDVKNLPPGTKVRLPDGQLWDGNDSYWIDLDYPVQSLPDGRRYKPLFAFFIMDLDGKLNVNVHGNIRGKGFTHLSHHGMGSWEVNLAKGLIAPDELPNLFRGNANTGEPGKYGPDLVPNLPLGAPDPTVRVPPYYSAYDSDAGLLAGGAYSPSQPFRLPGEGAPADSLVLDRFPRLDLRTTNEALGYDAGSAEEIANPVGGPLARLYGVFDCDPTRDRFFGPWELDALYRTGDTGTDALSGDLRRLLPLNMNDPRVRRLLTTHSFDVNRPGVRPWWYDRANYKYILPSTTQPTTLTYPQGFPPPGVIPMPPNPPAAGDSGEFIPNQWKARLPGLLPRLDLARPLPDYPPLDPNTGRIDLNNAQIMLQFAQAQQARQDLAREIFKRLCAATGASWDFISDQPLASRGTAEFEALRWLAQLAVNIVDYIDADDYMTPFNWWGQEFVFGTELPRLVINEAHAEYRRDVVVAGNFTVNVWVELYNPLHPDATLRDGGAARLQLPALGNSPGYAAYQLALAKHPEDHLYQPNNVRGDPNGFHKLAPPMGQPIDSIVKDWTGGPPNTTYVNPSGDNYTGVVMQNNGQRDFSQAPDRGFYLIGPGPLPAGMNPNPPPPVLTLSKQEMSYTSDNTIGGGPEAPPEAPIVLLRRLLCPALPENDPTQPTFNPNLPINVYVTVDYMVLEPDDLVNADQLPRNWTNEHSRGRSQPYAGYRGLTKAQQPEQPDVTGDGKPDPYLDQPQHTFLRHNAPEEPDWNNPPTYLPNQVDPNRRTLQLPFEWLVHLDRPPTSPMELLFVCATKPHLLTQWFLRDENNDGWAIDTPPQALEKHRHLAPWFNDANRLYHVFEYLCVGDRYAGTSSVTLIGATSVTPGDQLVTLLPPLTVFGITPGGGAFYRIEKDMWLVIDHGTPNEEVVQVLNVPDSARFLARFTKPHDAPYTIVVPLTSGRVPGRLNLNTVWDKEIIEALCDPQDANAAGFDQDDVQRVIEDLSKGRTRPFWSLASGYTDPTQPFNIGDTLLRPALRDPTRRLFESDRNHPYRRFELLSKIYNNVTVRSNCFAVWLTVGYFEVTGFVGPDDRLGRPEGMPILGPELGRADGQHVRHRFFAVVDRSLFEPWLLSKNIDVKEIVGKKEYDPRRDYTQANGPPATVIYWTTIQDR